METRSPCFLHVVIRFLPPSPLLCHVRRRLITGTTIRQIIYENLPDIVAPDMKNSTSRGIWPDFYWSGTGYVCYYGTILFSPGCCSPKTSILTGLRFVYNTSIGVQIISHAHLKNSSSTKNEMEEGRDTGPKLRKNMFSSKISPPSLYFPRRLRSSWIYLRSISSVFVLYTLSTYALSHKITSKQLFLTLKSFFFSFCVILRKTLE